MKQQQMKFTGWRWTVLRCILLLIIVLAAAFLTVEKVAFLPEPHVASLTLPANATLLAARKAQVNAAYGKLPLIFETNQGQSDPQVRFVSRGPSYTLFLTHDEAVFSLHETPLAKSEEAPVKFSTLRMRLVNANPQPEISGFEPLPTQVNYYQGQDPKQWHTAIPTYAKVQLQKVYPGIDLVYYGNQRQLEYDFVVAPSADPAQIRLTLAGLDEAVQTTLADNGDLMLKMGQGEMRWHKPVVYQDIAGQRQSVDGQFVLYPAKDKAAGIGFAIAAYDRTQALVIDPVLAYSTFLGGMSDDYATSIAVDNVGNAYVTGAAASTNFPSTIFTGGYDRSNLPSLKKMDVFVAKLDSTGQFLLFSTLLSGTLPEDKDDIGNGIVIDQFGTSVYVIGTTGSKTFPTISVPPAYNQSLSGSTDAFIAQFNANNGALLYSSYLGGGKDEGGTGITVDTTGNVYVTGYTTSIFPTAFPANVGNVYQPNLSGGADAFVVKFDPSWTMLYSTYFGGSKDDKGTGIAVD